MKFPRPFLITPESVEENPKSALSSLPKWVVTVIYVNEHIEPDEADKTNPMVVVFGKKHKKSITTTPLQLAYLLELCRFGHSVVTNSNFGKPLSKIYVKLSFRDAPEDNMPIARLFVDAGPNEATMTLGIVSDMRIKNLIKIGAGKPTKQSLEIAFGHAERLAKEKDAEGSLPEGISVKAYMDNLRALYAAVQLEAGLVDY